MKMSVVMLALTCALAPVMTAQSDAKSLFDAATKRVAAAKGKTGEEMTAVLKDAAGMFEQVTTRFPTQKVEFAKASLELGRVRRRLGDIAGAETALKQASTVAEEPRAGAEALHELAAMYKRAKRLPEAQAALERIVAEFKAEPRERADALLRLAGMHRRAKQWDASAAALRQVLAEHGDLWSSAVEALDDLVALELAQGHGPAAHEAFDAHGKALRAHYDGGKYEARLHAALTKTAARFEKVAPAKPMPEHDPKDEG